MAFKYWINTDGSGTWNAANFGGSLPANGDRVVFSGKFSNASIVEGLDRTGDTAGAGLYLDAIEVHDDYDGQIGSFGAPLTLGCKDVVYRGMGTLYIKGDGGSTERPIRNIVCNSNNKLNSVVLSNGSAAANAPEIVAVTSGRLWYLGPGVTTAGYNQFFCAPNGNSQASIIIDSQTRVNLVVNSGGEVHCRIGVEEFIHRSGTSYVNGGNAIGASDVDVVYQFGGVFVHDIPVGQGTVTQAHVMGGIFDMTQSGGNKTLGTWWKYASGTVKTNGPNIHTITTTYDLTGNEINSD